MTDTVRQLDLDQSGLEHLAELVALKVRPGDAIALHGDLGAGKTTFARALIRALLGDAEAEVPSPTFALAQSYTTPRLEATHFDLYRLGSAEEAREIGFEAALAAGLVLVEWPERAPELLPADRLDVVLSEVAGDATRRAAALGGRGIWAPRLARVLAMRDHLEALLDWRHATITYLQGDASARSYARLTRDDGRTAVLMDAPRMPDGPPVRDGRPYSRIAHLAEDMRPFAAVGEALRRVGCSAPRLLAHDLEQGFLLLEDLGDRVFGVEMRHGAPQAELWRAATDVLVELRRRLPPPDWPLPLPDGSAYRLPRFDRAALEMELDLLLDWYWPEVKGAPVPAAGRAEFHDLWRPVIDRLLAAPAGWFLRDYHSPNLIWLPERDGVAKVGLLDYQDALAEPWAFDLVSLLNDARVDVPEALERELLEHYCAEVTAAERGFDRSAFEFQYRAFGAQRRTRHLGLFVRLLRRDGKSQYLQHIPRAWEHLARCLAHPDLAAIKVWYERELPAAERVLSGGH